MKTIKNPHLEQNQHPLSKFAWSNESTMLSNTLLTAADSLFKPLPSRRKL